MNSFNLGLVMAGAVSAGAYSAGVVDYLLYALEAWEKARERGEAVPDHRTIIRVLAGSSAGGMVASLAGVAIADPDHRPITQRMPPGKPTHNRLYDAWVNGVDILDLFTDADLQNPTQEIMAILNTDAIPSVARKSLRLEKTRDLPAFVDPHLQIYLPTSNMCGLTYSLPMKGNIQDPDYEMVHHADFGHFYLGEPSPFLEGLGAEHLNLDQLSDFTRDYFVNSTVATGAFPFAFAPVAMHTHKRHYQNRLWRMNHDCANDQGRCFDYTRIEPSWQDSGPDFKFTAIDGGLFDNHPLDYARRVLTRAESDNPKALNQHTSKADSGLLMINPFPPVPPKKSFEPAKNFLELALRIAGSQRTNAHFKIQELIRAQDPNNGSLFTIAPKRAQLPYLASAGLDGFGGFFDVSFREHDYHLGRYNCQQFLRRYFVLKAENKLFESWRENQTLFNYYKVEQEDGVYLPVIPLTRELNETQFDPPSFPKISKQRFEEICEGIDRRSQLLAKHFFRQKIGSMWLRMPLQYLYNRTLSPLLANYLGREIKKHMTAHLDFQV